MDEDAAFVVLRRDVRVEVVSVFSAEEEAHECPIRETERFAAVEVRVRARDGVGALHAGCVLERGSRAPEVALQGLDFFLRPLREALGSSLVIGRVHGFASGSGSISEPRGPAFTSPAAWIAHATTSGLPGRFTVNVATLRQNGEEHIVM